MTRSLVCVATAFALATSLGADARSADEMAVEAVWSELVSRANSLIHRENTGNSPETGFGVRPDSPAHARFGVLRGLFP